MHAKLIYVCDTLQLKQFRGTSEKNVSCVILTGSAEMKRVENSHWFYTMKVSLKNRKDIHQMYSKQTDNGNSNYFYKKYQREMILQKLLIVQINNLQQRILETSNKVKTPSQALFQAYEMLCEEQKIAFLLAGGAEQLFRYQQQERLQEQGDKTDQSSSDSRTDDLPVLCYGGARTENSKSYLVSSTKRASTHFQGLKKGLYSADRSLLSSSSREGHSRVSQCEAEAF